LIDCLVHLELGRCDLDAAQSAGVTDVVTAGTDPLIDDHIVELVRSRSLHPGSIQVRRAFGIHPEQADDDKLAARMAALEQKLPHAVALGECGLDTREGMPPLEVQERTLRAQLALARKLRIPVLMHIVRAAAKTLTILEEEGPLPVGGVWHAFAGPKELIDRAVHLGLRLSVGALVMNGAARRLHEALAHIPSDHLVVETDAPDVPLTTLPEIIAAVARERGASVDDVRAQTTANAKSVYRL